MGLDIYAGFLHPKPEQPDNVVNIKDDMSSRMEAPYYWRKHARLQVFMNKQFRKQKDHKHNTIDDLQHLGFNAGEGGVKITEELIKELEEQVKNNYWDCFASDGFFWGQQFQEEAVKEYKSFDKKFIKWAKEQLKAGRQIGYDCSW